MSLESYINKMNELTAEVNYSTVLDIIRKPYDEVFISRLLGYLFNPKSNGNDPIFLNKFCEKINITQRAEKSDKVKVYLEKFAYDKRIDVLIEVTGKFIIAIENKINSLEYDNQTDHYYEFCEKQYAKYALRKYVFLKPHYNCAEPKNKNFYTVTYDDIIKILKSILNGKNENYNAIAKDFMEHCGRYLMKEIIITKNDLLYLNYINEIIEARNSYENKMKQIKNLVETEINKFEILKHEIADAGNTYRFYKDEWWEDPRFYLYSEVKYNNNALNDIECQITIKGYTNNDWDLRPENSWFKNMIKSLQEKNYEIIEIVSTQWYVIQRKKFNEFDFEKRQISELVNKISDTMSDFINQSKKIAEIIHTTL